jgi:hypothetical protein
METKQREANGEFIRLMNKLGPVVSNEAGFRNMQNYLHGLLGKAAGKNGCQMSE